MQEQFFAHVNANPERIHIPDGMVPKKDMARYCKQYDKQIRDAGGMDLLVLGIGPNGHIGFNEPGTSANILTHVTKLTEETRRANARFFDNDISKVPTHAITMGPKTILGAKKILLLATGEKKTDAVFESLTGELHKELPASFLQQHPDTVFYTDMLAAKRFLDYFPQKEILR
jgi:glucosamine-6-phosphate deaminase